jgi:uncharacterized protein (DUF58 family)
MMPRELRHKLRYIEIISNRGSRSHKAGDFRSRQLGRGFEFDEHRPYRMGDDYRLIDWNVTARLQHPYLKKTFEERELSAILVIDVSRSMHFTSGEQSKRELLLEVVATLAFSAVADGIRLGLLLFTKEVELFMPPRQGRARVWNMLDAVWAHEPRSTGTNIDAALRFLASSLSRMAMIFFVSDFIGQQELDQSPSFKIISRRHDLIPVIVGDPLEEELPEGRGLIRLRDAETGESIEVSIHRQARESYRQALAARRERLHKAFSSHGVRQVQLHAGRDYVSSLMRFFFARKRR